MCKVYIIQSTVLCYLCAGFRCNTGGGGLHCAGDRTFQYSDPELAIKPTYG